MESDGELKDMGREETRAEVFEALLEAWEADERAIIDEWCGASAPQMLEDLEADVLEWRARWARAGEKPDIMVTSLRGRIANMRAAQMCLTAIADLGCQAVCPEARPCGFCAPCVAAGEGAGGTQRPSPEGLHAQKLREMDHSEAELADAQALERGADDHWEQEQRDKTED